MGIFDMDDDDNDDYFGMASNTVQQFQYPSRVAYPGYPSTMPAHLHYPVTQGTVGASNPLNAWMTFYSPYPSLHSRSKRAISAADKRKFVEDMANYKEQKMAKMGNLTCVLAKYGLLDANLQINLSAYTGGDMWNHFADDEQPDPEWKEKVIDGYKNCYELSQSIPQSFLEMKGPVYKKFGRQKMFFKCTHKMECMMCVKKELVKWVEILYGKDALNQREKYDLSKDKYD